MTDMTKESPTTSALSPSPSCAARPTASWPSTASTASAAVLAACGRARARTVPACARGRQGGARVCQMHSGHAARPLPHPRLCLPPCPRRSAQSIPCGAFQSAAVRHAWQLRWSCCSQAGSHGPLQSGPVCGKGWACDRVGKRCRVDDSEQIVNRRRSHRCGRCWVCSDKRVNIRRKGRKGGHVDLARRQQRWGGLRQEGWGHR